MSPSVAESRLRGVPLSPGVALGRGCFYRQPSNQPIPIIRTVAVEEMRLRDGLTWMVQRLEVLAEEADAKAGAEAADIFRAHRMILKDPTLTECLFDAILKEGLDAEAAIRTQLDRLRERLREADTQYLRERAEDISDLRCALLEQLRRMTPTLCCVNGAECDIGECRLGNDHILIAPELTPSLTMRVDCHTRGFVVEHGGQTSHAAILARALGLPAVTGIADAREAIPIDAQVLIDADSGEVILNPSETTLERYRRALAEEVEQLTLSEPVPELNVMANIDWAEGVYDAVTVQADGVGLYRTEIEALAEGRVPSEEEQEARYTEVVQTMAGKPVYIRLYDFGSDKAAPWLGLACEHNPALGLRGARFLLSRPELVRTQARALARASQHGPLSVVYPMILDSKQFVELRALVLEAIRGVSHGPLYHGVMFEIPSCCMQVSELLEEADFGCIGANDLVQYLFAADRTNESVDYDRLLVNPLLWDFIKQMVDAAKKTGKTLGMCGHLAGDVRFTQRIIDLGITTISIAPNHICAVRRAAQNQPKANHH